MSEPVHYVVKGRDEPDHIRVESTHDSLRIWINDHLHVYIDAKSLVAVQMWIERGHTNHVIEYTFDNGAQMRSEYDRADRFFEIVGKLAKVL